MLEQWAEKYSISAEAINELRYIFGCLPVVVNKANDSESAVQNDIRLEGVPKGVTLWRNNVGVLRDARGVPVRYGLANDSPRLNAVCKSGDLIGWRKLLVTPTHVGSYVAQFVSRECKRAGWKYKGDAHEQAQLKWAQRVVADGGDAMFASGVGTL